MDQFSKQVQDGLKAARQARDKRRARLYIEAGGQRIAVVRAWSTGFAVEAGTADPARGYVDLYEGARHLSRCLIVTSREEDGERVYEYKRATAATDAAPVDFERAPGGPAGLLPQA
ncbi:hypothetical protein [Histidinibacterium lentulum]|uniref:Uncharacterized protein n=1 Tax=Histidinibacterium lentulum TaxID=2480588 RepID=A0A3N2R5U5_9RHOB|nr:hypothetical protein [Histidinibacterium lentulum]ROU02726.1 hypothetical protein EAT49_10435 [Histidinibacterium lentulum]